MRYDMSRNISNGVSHDMSYDVIGDIHGQAGKLEALLREMGYTEVSNGWVPPAGRKAVFLGDLIDRGPEQLKVLNIVRSMVWAGHAHCIMGNHEFNAIGYVTPHRSEPQRFLRKHSDTKVAQHVEFLAQVREGSDVHRELIDWFRTLPPMLDLGGLRVVHAWWHQPYVDLIDREFWDGDRMSEDFLHAAFEKGSAAWAAMEGLTKGQEVDLPDPHHYFDHAGVPRNNVRTKWWLKGEGGFREVGIVPGNEVHRLPDLDLPDHYVGGNPDGAPVLVGHYWFSGEPVVQTPKVACLDWSAAKDGPLVAYRWDGEQELTNDKFVAAGA